MLAPQVPVLDLPVFDPPVLDLPARPDGARRECACLPCLGRCSWCPGGHPVLACCGGALSKVELVPGSAAVTVPSGPGSHSQRACGLDQPPRPSAIT